ncbi:MAG: type II secretion system F family protein [Myxococcales bacterium]|nr:MAG: type II secretion system F family protein [Myxococcales bacterium]
MNIDWLISHAGIVLIGIALGILFFAVLRQPLSPRPTRGLSGLKRQRALEQSALFSLVEPAMRYLASWVSRFSIQSHRDSLQKQIKISGEYLGLSADEYIALMIFAGTVFGSAGAFLTLLGYFPPYVVLIGIAIGAWLPSSMLAESTKKRFKAIGRGLPPAIDLAALCMSAGMDFVGALRQIVRHTPVEEDAIHEELDRILQELELGHTRKQALEAFAERVPTEAVKDFVSAVRQAEEKGNPLAEVLQIQATMLRMRRSVLAEEAAARAEVMMMIPLMMLFASIMIILLGPLVINTMQSGL